MDYNLAKELKESGFPNSDAWLDNGNGFWVDMGEFSYAVPTLEELIEACGDEFELLRMAYQVNDKYFITQRHTTGEFYHGSTPSEAVAKLLLTLLKNGHIIK